MCNRAKIQTTWTRRHEWRRTMCCKKAEDNTVIASRIDNKDADTLQEAKEYADEKDAYKLDKIWTDLTNPNNFFSNR